MVDKGRTKALVLPRIASKIKFDKDMMRYYCRRCMTLYISKKAFYITNNPTLDSNGCLSICSDCCKELLAENLNYYKKADRAVYELCRLLDLQFSYTAFDMALKHVNSAEKRKVTANASNYNINAGLEDMFGFYISKLFSFAGKDTDSPVGAFSSSDKFKFDSDYVVDENDSKENNNQPETDEEKLKRYVLFWGSGKDSKEYEFLENEFQQLRRSFECNDYAMETIMKDIAHINLAIDKDRQQGGDAIKLIEARRKLMEDAKLKPVQATGIDANDTVTFGTLIKRYEETKPIPKRLDDEMKKYIDTYFVGQLAKMEGIQNEITEKMDKELSDFDIEFNPEDEEDSEEE